MVPTDERLDCHVHRAVKAGCAERAHAAGQSLNEWVSNALCGVLGLDPGVHPVPRKPPGRRVGFSPRRRGKSGKGDA
jgi:hypothetical protein